MTQQMPNVASELINITISQLFNSVLDNRENNEMEQAFYWADGITIII